jgi:hypothetical protein
MALRIRTLKPEWLDDERIASLSDEARIMSVALILLADDYGCGRAHPMYLASRVWPYRDPHESLMRVSRGLHELREIGYVAFYRVHGQHYYAITKWERHQRVQHPSKTRHIPAQNSEDAEPCEALPETLMRSSGESHEILMTDLDLDLDLDLKKQDQRESLRGRAKIADVAHAQPLKTEIAQLEARYADDALVRETRAACALSRRNGKMSDAVWLRTLQRLSAFRQQSVIGAMREFVEKWADGSRAESYLIAIAKSAHDRVSNGTSLTLGGYAARNPNGMAPPSPPEHFKEKTFDDIEAQLLGTAERPA